MRSAGFVLAALLIAASIGLAQPAVPGQPVPGQPARPVSPAVPGQPVPGQSAQPVPLPAQKADPQLDGHLVAWEKKMAGITNFRTDISLKRTEPVRKSDTNYVGVVSCMKPNYAFLQLNRLNSDGKRDPVDYEAFICNGKAVYAYNGVQKTVTEILIPQNQAGVDNLMLDFLAGMKAGDAKERFDISLDKTDEHYIYLNIKPRRPADQREFQLMTMALYGPGPKTAAWAYLPRRVDMLKPSNDIERWEFSDPKVNIPGLRADDFKYQDLGKAWTFQKAPQQPVGGGNPPSNGGVVRPNR